MTLRSDRVRLFVSSTFLDFQLERNALHTRVFPRFRQWCASHGMRFQPIDLRWGISDAAAAGQLTLPLCLQEIDRCQSGARPGFLALIGNRYGWRPPPAAIAAGEFERIVGSIAEGGAADLVRAWYVRDDNALPPEYRLRPRVDAWCDPARWQPVERDLARTLREAARVAGLGADDRLKYEASATEQEIARAVLGPQGDPSAAICVVRRYLDEPRTGAGAWRADRDEAEGAPRLSALIDRLSAACGDRLYRFDVRAGDEAARAAYLDRFCAGIEAALVRAADAADAHDTLGAADRERAAQAAFAAERRTGFVGRGPELAAVIDRLDAGTPHPVVVCGPPGSGKSAFMARLEHEFAARTGLRVVARFAGATPLCGSGRGLVSSLLMELQPSAGRTAASVQAEPEDAVLARLLRTWPPTTPLVLLLDAVDQLSGGRLGGAAGARQDEGVELPWLPSPLPPHVRVVLSTASDAVAALAPVSPVAAIELGALGAADSGALLDAWLAAARRTLQPAQRAAALQAPESGFPLYLRIAAEACASWRSGDPPRALAPTLPLLVRQYLDRLVEPDMHGTALAARALGYLACSRFGLTEDEILDLLSADPDVQAEVAAAAHHQSPDGRVPVVLWARLSQDLLATLTQRLVDGDTVIGYYHRLLEAGVRERFVAGAAEQDLHARLAEYFRQDARPRALSERPYQQAAAGQRSAFQATMTEVPYLQARVRAHGTMPLLEDFALMPGTGPAAGADAWDLDPLRQALERSAHALDRDAVQVRTHLLARLPATDSGPIARVREQIAAGCDTAWVEPVRTSLAPAVSRLVRSIPSGAGGLVALAANADGRALLAAGTDGIVRLWRHGSPAPRRTLGAGGTPVTWLCAGASLRACATGYGDDRARLWDIEAAAVVEEVSTASRQPLAASWDGRLVAVAGEDGRIAIWDLDARRVVASPAASLSHHSVACFTCDGRRCVVAGIGEMLVVSLGDDRTPERRWRAPGGVRAVHATADPAVVLMVVTAPLPGASRYASEERVRLVTIDIESGQVRWSVPGRFEEAWCAPTGSLAVARAQLAPKQPGESSPGFEVVAFDLERCVRRWARLDARTQTSILEWSPSTSHALCLEVEFEEFQYSSEAPHQVSWLDLATGARAGEPVARQPANIRSLHVVARNDASLGTTCAVADTLHFTSPQGPTLEPVVTPGACITGVAAVEEGARIATASTDGILRVWERVRRADAPQAIRGAAVRAVARAAPRSLVVVRASAIERIDMDTWVAQGHREAAVPILASEIGLSAVSVNGRWVAYLERATLAISHVEMYMWPMEVLNLWDAVTATRTGSFETRLAGGPQLSCTHLALADSGTRVAVGVERPETAGAAVAIWTPAARDAPLEVEVRASRLGAVAFARDGLRLASGWTDGEIVLSRLDRRLPAVVDRTSTTEAAPVCDMVWSPDARWLAWSREDGTIATGRASARRGLHGVTRFKGDAARLVYAPDGSHLLAIGDVLVWHRLPDGEAVASLELDAPVVDAAVLEDGLVAVADTAGDVHLFRVRDPLARPVAAFAWRPA